MKKVGLFILLLTFGQVLLVIPHVSSKVLLKDEVGQIREILQKSCGHNALGQKLAYKLHGPFISNNGKFAIATCVFGEGGGQTFLRKSVEGKWIILLSGGGAFSQEGLISELKIPKKEVDSMYRQIEAADKLERKKKISK